MVRPTAGRVGSGIASVAAALAVLAGSLGLASCGGEAEGDTPEVRWFVAIQPGGSIQEIAKRCTEESDGRYEVTLELLPTDADPQREQLVRRLGAEDSTVDLIGMDVIWTAEFAERGLAAPVHGQAERAGDRGHLRHGSRHRILRGRALRRAVQLQHAAALVPQGPGAEAAGDLGRDDRRGGGARRGGDDPGPGQSLRGLHGLGQRR